MAILIGGTSSFPGINNHLIGTSDGDIVFGDPFTTSNFFGVPEIGGTLSSGSGGDDWLEGRGSGDQLFGDAWAITGTGQGGNDLLEGGTGNDESLYGDAFILSETGRGGGDTLRGGSGNDRLVGDANEMYNSTLGGNDRLEGGRRTTPSSVMPTS